MADPKNCPDALLRRAAELLTGDRRRLFQAEVTRDLCDGNARRAERRFGWGRGTVTKGLREQNHEFQCVGNFAARGRKRWEQKNPQFAQDIRELVEPRSQTHPELKLERGYTNMSAEEVLDALRTEKGYLQADLPRVRTMRDILNRMNYRLKRICKAKPLKKTPLTDAIFANVRAVKAEMKPLSPPTPTAAEVPVVTAPVNRPSPTLERAATESLKAEMKPRKEVVEVVEVVEAVETEVKLPTPARADAPAMKDRVKRQSETLEMSMDTKAKVSEGDYARGGKKPDRVRR